MAIKQYIGARYTPLLDGDYDPNKAYDPLTTVNYAQATYTSKKKVPAGILPTDSEYWMQTGFGSQETSALLDWKNNTVDPFMQQTNTDLTGIRADLTTAQNDIATAQGDIATAQSDIATAQGDIATAQSDITTAQGNISNIQSEITTLHAKDADLQNQIDNIDVGNKIRKFLLVGDSFLGLSGTTWADGFRSGLAATTECQIIEQDGVGFANNGGSAVNKRFAEVIRDAALTIPANEVTDIIIIGGVNDSLQTETAIKTGVEDFYTQAKNKCPNAEIYIGFAGLINNVDQESALRDKVLPTMQSVIMPDLSYLNGVENVMHNYDDLADGNRHPNAATNYKIGVYAYKAWKTGFADYSVKETFANVFNIYGQGTSSVVGSVVQKNDLIHYTITPPSGEDIIKLDWGRAITIQPYTSISLCRITEKQFMLVDQNKTEVFMGKVRLYRDAGLTTYDELIMNCYIVGNDIAGITQNSTPIQYGFGIGIERMSFNLNTNNS